MESKPRHKLPPVVQALQKKLNNRVLVGDALEGRYTHIWTMNQPLKALAVVLPKSTQELSETLKICHEFKQPICIHGGLTNLVGATRTNEDEVVISLEKMNAILEIDPQSRSISVEAGVILEDIQVAANAVNMLFPLNFGAKGSAQIGGIISTNAGGLRVFRFGMTRALVLGLEVVLADGTVLSSMKKIIKDNSAYDLKQLFIGSEGTLGIVSKAVLKLIEAPKSRTSAFAAVNAYDKVVEFLKFMDAGLAGTLSGFELIWGSCYQLMTSPPAHNKPPLPHGFNYYILLESLGSHQENDQQQLEHLLEQAFTTGLIQDAALAHTESDVNWFWSIREDVKVIKDQCHIDHHFDISLPIPQIGQVIAKITNQLNALPAVNKVLAFGHVADGNIHLIVDKVNASKELRHQIDEIVYAPLQSLGGSVSAEHGIGIDKKRYLSWCRTEEEIRTMKLLKRSLDPHNLLNRGRVLEA